METPPRLFHRQIIHICFVGSTERLIQRSQTVESSFRIRGDLLDKFPSRSSGDFRPLIFAMLNLQKEWVIGILQGRELSAIRQ